MKIYILDAFHPAGVEYAAKHFDIVRWDDPKVKDWHAQADGVMVRMTPIGASDIERANKVRIISKQGVGYDTIDVAAARKRGIPVCISPGVNSEAVSCAAWATSAPASRASGATLSRRS
jgi:D-3-phosphoglycerate dehydrogenase